MKKVIRPIAQFLRKGHNCSEEDLKYLPTLDLIPYPDGSYLIGVRIEDDCDDTISIGTMSTNATMDDIPGAGRIIDKCFYQFLGRKIERFANRISITYLHPVRIAQCLWMDVSSLAYNKKYTLDDVVGQIQINSRLPCEGRVVVAGLKSLVKQSQSMSLYQSAAALAYLIILSTSWPEYGNFYEAVSEVEPIFHLEELANAMDDSNSEKKYFIALTRLARTPLNFMTNVGLHDSTTELAHTLRQRLIKLLELYRPQNPFVVIGDACLLFAECFYALGGIECHERYRISISSLWELTYFVIIFLTHCITSLNHQTRYMESSTRRLGSLVLTTYIRWMQTILTCYLRDKFDLRNLKHIQHICALYSALFVAMQMDLLPRKTFLIPPFTNQTSLPRRIRAITPSDEVPALIRHQTQACIPRSRRLLSSLDELEREIRDVTLSASNVTPHFGWHESHSDREYSDKALEFSCERAWQVLSWKLHLSENDLKWELYSGNNDKLARFHNSAAQVYACEKGLTWGFMRAILNHSSFNNWRWYKEKCQDRHRWGVYFRSNLDWDWDTTSYLKRLFEVEKPKELPRKGPPVRATIDTDESSRCSLNVTIVDPHYPLEAVYVRYTTKSGEIKCMTFLPEENTQEY